MTKGFLGNGKEAKVEERSITFVRNNQGSLQNLSQSKPQFGQEAIKTSKNYEGNEHGSASRSGCSEYSSKSQPESRPQLVIPGIPAANLRISQPMKLKESGSKVPSGSGASGSQRNTLTPTKDNTIVKAGGDRSYRESPEPEVTARHTKSTKRKLVHWMGLSTCGRFRVKVCKVKIKCQFTKYN